MQRNTEKLAEYPNRINLVPNPNHMSLNFDELETPEQAFYRKSSEIIFGNFVVMSERLL